MTITDFVWIAVGEALLAGTFALGILVGISLTRKGLRHDDYDTAKATAGKDTGWYHAGNESSSSRPDSGNQGGADSGHTANHAKRQAR
jgi:hypothetical protein